MNYPTIKNAPILIIDDQEANIDVLEGLLEIQGYTNVRSIADPREALPVFKEFNPDLILLDLMMPHLSGYEVMEQVNALIPTGSYLPILVLTADITPEAKKRALAAGAKDFLSKPFDLVEVGLRIRNLLETRLLHRQLENQNQELDQRVRERTAELEKTNAQLRAARDKAEASDRLKTAFMQNISHEVRTPLNGILNFGSLLANPDISPEEKQKFIPMLQTSSNRLMHTITDYMDISLIASGNMDICHTQLNVGREFADLKLNFEGAAAVSNLLFEVSAPTHAEDLVITTDPELFRKVLSHLLDNAFKFTHEGKVTLGYTLEPGNIVFFVKDTGIGIADDAQNRVFENFMQEEVAVTRGHEGSGLGLSIVRGIANLLGAEIRLESSKGVGTTFYFSLPYTGSAVGPDDTAENTIPATEQAHQPVVLITDDDDINRFCLEYALQDIASVILQAKDGREAVDLCQEHPEISMILMDIKMPVMDGLEATREIRKFNKEVVIIAQTAFIHAGVREDALTSGCNDYVAKPIESDALRSLIEMHLA
jgi:two-component system, sensor histidine kinase and response regulator